jgi:hypothetical protein
LTTARSEDSNSPGTCGVASPDHAGPVDVAAFLDLLDEDEIAFTKRDAYEQVQALIRRI